MSDDFVPDELLSKRDKPFVPDYKYTRKASPVVHDPVNSPLH